jgi:hypothetical protein
MQRSTDPILPSHVWMIGGLMARDQGPHWSKQHFVEVMVV